MLTPLMESSLALQGLGEGSAPSAWAWAVAESCVTPSVRLLARSPIEAPLAELSGRSRKLASVVALSGAGADAVRGGGELARVVHHVGVDAQVAGRGAGEEGVESQRGQHAAGVVGEGELRVRVGGRRARGWPSDTLAVRPLIAAQWPPRGCSRVVSPVLPFSWTLTLVVCTAPVVLFCTRTWNEPLLGGKASPALSRACAGIARPWSGWSSG